MSRAWSGSFFCYDDISRFCQCAKTAFQVAPKRFSVNESLVFDSYKVLEVTPSKIIYSVAIWKRQSLILAVDILLSHT
jgi:hypothetical protein